MFSQILRFQFPIADLEEPIKVYDRVQILQAVLAMEAIFKAQQASGKGIMAGDSSV